MSPRSLELLDLVVRWVHVIAGIMWIGNSLLFNWLDRILEPAPESKEGKQGHTWLIHSGGFYRLEKTQLIGRELPRPLHWFKWQAYTTWISGAVLLVLVYYVSGRALMIGGARPDLSTAQATAVGAGAIVATWLVYETVWRFVHSWSATAATVLSGAGIVALVLALTHLLSGRAAFLHVGAALGTLMAWNVAHTIMPSQRTLVAALREGRRSDPVIADRAKMRSIHNNYLTYPVVILMMSSHFPSVYGHRLSWLLLLVLVAGGAAVRHVLNLRFTVRQWVPALAATILVSVIALYGVVHAAGRRQPAADEQLLAGDVSFEQVRSIIDRRCTVCHSSVPADLSFGPAPGGAAFDTPEQIQALAGRVHQRAVATRTMPPANTTRMTEAERLLLGRWAESAHGR